MSYAQMAADGLAHQRSQGHGEYKVPPGPRISFYKLVDSVLPNTKDASGHEKDFFDGIDTSLSGLAALGDDKVRWLASDLRQISNDVENAKGKQTDEAVEPLLDSFNRLNSSIIRVGNSSLSTGRKNALVDALEAKDTQASNALNLALGISAEASTSGPDVVSPGDQVKFRVRFHNASRYDLQTSHGGPLPRLDLGLDAPH